MCVTCGAETVKAKGLCGRCYTRSRKQARIDSALERVEPGQRAWLVESFGEGMPAAWIAETLGLSVPVVYEIARGLKVRRRPESVWPMIHGHPELVRMHREFAPGRAGRS